MVKIYALINPVTDVVFYIGKTNRTLCRRLSEHLNLSKGVNGHKNNTIKKILSEGRKPIIKLIEEVDLDKWVEREKFHINDYRNKGYNLCNVTDGGEPGGNFIGKKHTEQTKIKMCLAWKNRIIPDNFDKKMREVMSFSKVCVLQKDINGDIIKEWNCIRDAARELNLSPSGITNNCKGRQKTHGGFIWEYKPSL